MAQWSDFVSPDQGAMMPETFANPAVDSAIRGAADMVATPGKLAAPNPYRPGTEQWYWYEGQRQAGQEKFGRDAALATMGTGAIAGVPVKAGEVAIGAGPTRRISDFIEAPAVKGKGALIGEGGLPIAGPAYTKEARRVLDEIDAGPKGAGPLDLSSQVAVPEVPQVGLDRYTPKRGVSPRLQEAMESTSVKKGIDKSIDEGLKLGVDKWYHTEPVRRAFVDELGPQGQGAFSKYMDQVAATSPRSDVPVNIRNASYYYQHALGDRDLPPDLPYPYGHVAQNLHRSNFEKLTEPRAGELSAASSPRTSTNWDVFTNPKPASFSENLQGNLTPVTVDTHAFRNIGMRTGDPRFLETSFRTPYRGGDNADVDSMARTYGEIHPSGKYVTYRPQQLHKEGRLSVEEAKKIPSFWATQPNENEYAAAEQLYQQLAKKRGMAPADAQAAAWSGAGKLTGLASPASKTFSELMNERVLFTARMRNEDPRQTLADFIQGRKPLLSVGGAAGAGGAVAASGGGEERY